MKKEIKLLGAKCENKRHEWVPAIPEPYFHLIRLECDCGEKFWSRKRYEEHYALAHILNY